MNIGNPKLDCRCHQSYYSRFFPPHRDQKRYEQNCNNSHNQPRGTTSTKCQPDRSAHTPHPSRSHVSKICLVSDSVRGHPLQIMDAAHKTSDPLDRPDCYAYGIRSNTAAPFYTILTNMRKAQVNHFSFGYILLFNFFISSAPAKAIPPRLLGQTYKQSL